MMTLEEHAALISNVLNNLAEQGTVSELLTQISEDYAETTAALNAAQAENETLKAEVENLKENNMKLFLKVTQPIKDSESEESEEEPENVSFDELFDENGELK